MQPSASFRRITSHIAMEPTRKKHPNGYWTKERCLQSAKGYGTKNDWATSAGSAYQRARANKWLVQCCGHMGSPQKPSGYWTRERCREDAERFRARKEWFKGSPSAYLAASRNGWLDWCCGHMKNKTDNGAS